MLLSPNITKSWDYSGWQYQDSESSWNQKKNLTETNVNFHIQVQTIVQVKNRGAWFVSSVLIHFNTETSGATEVHAAMFKSTWNSDRQLLLFSSCILFLFCLPSVSCHILGYQFVLSHFQFTASNRVSALGEPDNLGVQALSKL